MAERVGFEPTCRLRDKTLSRRPRYDHFGTSPHRQDRVGPQELLIIPACRPPRRLAGPAVRDWFTPADPRCARPNSRLYHLEKLIARRGAGSRRHVVYYVHV